MQLQRHNSVAWNLMQCRAGLTASLSELRTELYELEHADPPPAPLPRRASSAKAQRASLDPLPQAPLPNDAWGTAGSGSPPGSGGGTTGVQRSPSGEAQASEALPAAEEVAVAAPQAEVVAAAEADEEERLVPDTAEAMRQMAVAAYVSVEKMEEGVPPIRREVSKMDKLIKAQGYQCGLALLAYLDHFQYLKPLSGTLTLSRLAERLGLKITRELLWELSSSLPETRRTGQQTAEVRHAMKSALVAKRDTRGAESRRQRLAATLLPFQSAMKLVDLTGARREADGVTSGMLADPPDMPAHILELSALVAVDPTVRMSAELQASQPVFKSCATALRKLNKKAAKHFTRGEKGDAAKAEECVAEMSVLIKGALDMREKRVKDVVLYAETEAALHQTAVEAWAAKTRCAEGYLDYQERVVALCEHDTPLVELFVTNEKEKIAAINKSLATSCKSMQKKLDANAVEIEQCTLEIEQVLKKCEGLLEFRRTCAKQHNGYVEKARKDTAVLSKNIALAKKHIEVLTSIARDSKMCKQLGEAYTDVVGLGYVSPPPTSFHPPPPQASPHGCCCRKKQLIEKLAVFTETTLEREKVERVEYRMLMEQYAEMYGEVVARKDNTKHHLLSKVLLPVSLAGTVRALYISRRCRCSTSSLRYLSSRWLTRRRRALRNAWYGCVHSRAAHTVCLLPPTSASRRGTPLRRPSA